VRTFVWRVALRNTRFRTTTSTLVNLDIRSCSLHRELIAADVEEQLKGIAGAELDMERNRHVRADSYARRICRLRQQRVPVVSGPMTA
jgi:hypothetical protein